MAQQISQLSKADEAIIKDKLSGVFGSVYLRVDGYLLNVCIDTVKRKLVIAVYVNGIIDFSLVKQGCGEDDIDSSQPDIVKRFWRRQFKGSSVKHIKVMERLLGKKKAIEEGIYKKNVAFYTYFHTPGGFCQHLKKHNHNIKLIDYDTYKKLRDEICLD